MILKSKFFFNFSTSKTGAIVSSELFKDSKLTYLLYHLVISKSKFQFNFSIFKTAIVNLGLFKSSELTNIYYYVIW
jgi:hypothetical protein